MAIDVVALMQRLRNAAAEVSEAIAFWRLEGATHIRRFRATARAAAHLVEWKEHYLSQRLLDVPMTHDVFGRLYPCVNLKVEDQPHFAAAIDLLEDAVGCIFSGVAYNDRRNAGITTISHEVCEQLRHAIDLLDQLLKGQQATVPANRRQPDARKRELILEALDTGKTLNKHIQLYVSTQLGTDEKVSKKMIAEVRKFRAAQQQKK